MVETNPMLTAHRPSICTLKHRYSQIRQLFTDISTMYSSDDPDMARLRGTQVTSVTHVTLTMMLANVASGACVLLAFAPNILLSQWVWLSLLTLVCLLSSKGWDKTRRRPIVQASPKSAHRATVYAAVLATLWAWMVLT
jgi:hypothetical protein